MLIQVLGVGMGLFFIDTIPSSGNLPNVGLWIFLAGFPIAIIVGVVLALRWGYDLKQKLMYIFLMPTHYAGPLLLLWSFMFIGRILRQMFEL